MELREMSCLSLQPHLAPNPTAVFLWFLKASGLSCPRALALGGSPGVWMAVSSLRFQLTYSLLRETDTSQLKKSSQPSFTLHFAISILKLATIYDHLPCLFIYIFLSLPSYTFRINFQESKAFITLVTVVSCRTCFVHSRYSINIDWIDKWRCFDKVSENTSHLK